MARKLNRFLRELIWSQITVWLSEDDHAGLHLETMSRKVSLPKKVSSLRLALARLEYTISFLIWRVIQPFAPPRMRRWWELYSDELLRPAQLQKQEREWELRDPRVVFAEFELQVKNNLLMVASSWCGYMSFCLASSFTISPIITGAVTSVADSLVGLVPGIALLLAGLAVMALPTVAIVLWAITLIRHTRRLQHGLDTWAKMRKEVLSA